MLDVDLVLLFPDGAKVILLTPTTSLNPTVASALASHKGRVARMKYLGDVNAVSAPVRAQAESLLR